MKWLNKKPWLLFIVIGRLRDGCSNRSIVLFSPFYIVLFPGELFYNHYLKSEHLAQVGKFGSYGLVGALRFKPSNSGLTQRLNQKPLVIFTTVILPYGLAWNSSVALGTAFSMLTRASIHMCSSFCLPTVAI